MPNSCLTHAQHMPKICRRYVQDIPKICPRYAKDMPKICPRYTLDMPKISPKYARDIPKIYKYIFLKYARDMPQICQRYAQDSKYNIAKFCKISKTWINDSPTWIHGMLAHRFFTLLLPNWAGPKLSCAKLSYHQSMYTMLPDWCCIPILFHPSGRPHTDIVRRSQRQTRHSTDYR